MTFGIVVMEMKCQRFGLQFSSIFFSVSFLFKWVLRFSMFLSNGVPCFPLFMDIVGVISQYFFRLFWIVTMEMLSILVTILF